MPDRVFVDTDVLYPVALTDLHVSAARLFEPARIAESLERHDALYQREQYDRNGVTPAVCEAGTVPGSSAISVVPRGEVVPEIVTNDRRLRREITRLGTLVQALTNDQFATFMVQQVTQAGERSHQHLGLGRTASMARQAAGGPQPTKRTWLVRDVWDMLRIATRP